MNKSNNKPLTVKQERFCLELSLHGNATAAYKAAYSCKKMSYESIKKEADNLKKEPKILARVQELQMEEKARYNLKKEDTIALLAKIIGFELKDIYITNEETGESRLRTPEEIPRATREIIQQVEETKDGTQRYKMYSKLDAIKQLSSLLGWESEKKIEVSTKERNILRIGFEED